MTGNERDEVIRQVEHAISLLVDAMNSACIPEVGMNLVYAIPGARDQGDVAGVQGRIVRLGTAVHPVGDVVFGASDHIARIVLTAMKFDPRIRSAANIRFSEKTVRLLEEMMLDVCSFDRTVEPPGVKTMDWGVAQCCRNGVPDIIFDRGAVGKEPMVRVLGEDPVTIARNIIMLSGRIKDTNV